MTKMPGESQEFGVAVNFLGDGSDASLHGAEVVVIHIITLTHVRDCHCTKPVQK